MKRQEYVERDGKKVWLSSDEGAGLFDAADGTEQELALAFGVRCGLRAAETVESRRTTWSRRPRPRIRVWESEGDRYRETPLPDDLAATVEAYADVRDEGPDVPLVDESTRTVERWVTRAAERRQVATSDAGWQLPRPARSPPLLGARCSSRPASSPARSWSGAAGTTGARFERTILGTAPRMDANPGRNAY